MLNGKFAMAMAAAMVLAGLYGCSSSGIKNDRNAARAAQMMAEEERDAANAAAEAAMAAQMMAEGERDAANAAAEAAMAAQMMAEGERDAANAAAEAAMAAQMMAEGERDAANAAAEAAAAAQMMAEEAQAAAVAAQMMAEEAQAAAVAAQMTAEEERDAADTAKMMADDAAAAAVAAQGMAEGERDAANTAKMTADDAAAAAEMRAMDAATAAAAAETRATDAAAAQMTAEGERDAANTAKMTADDAAAAAEMRATDAEAAKMTADDLAAAAEMRATDAEAAQMTAEGERETAEGERDAAVIAQMEAEARLAKALISVSYTQAYSEYQAANSDYISALDAYGAMEADVDEATKVVAAAQNALTEAQEAVSAATNGTTDEQRQASAAVTVAMTAVENANNELAQARTTMSSMPYAMAIRTQDVMPDGTAEATRKGSAVTVTVMRGMSEVAKNVGARSIGNGWYKAAEVGETGDTATVYTDIENTMQKFNDFHVAAKDNIESVADTGVLTLATTTEDQRTLFNKYAMASGFPSTDEGAVTYTYGDDEDTDTTDRATEFSGNYHGISGKFSCDGADCAMTAKSEGITLIVGTWTFIPAYLGPDGTSLNPEIDDDAAKETRVDDLSVPNVAIPDPDYLRFGWWTMVDEDDGEVMFRTFYGGESPYSNGGFGNLTGEAKYVGLAAGRYAAKTFNTNATLDSLRHGEFTATATLTARFAGPDIAVNKQSQIEGMVDSFKDENGRAMAGWSVTLKPLGTGTLSNGADPITAAGQDPGRDGGVSGGVAGSPVSSGGWEAQFFGDPAEDATGDALVPGAIAGKFDAHSSHGHVGGAFGAEKQ